MRSYPTGTRLPDSLHAVSCSLPTMESVIGYEEKRPELLAQLSSGYPRFVSHPLVLRSSEVAAQELGLDAQTPRALLGSESAARAAIAYAGGGQLHAIDDLFLAATDAGGDSERLRRFVQHSGAGVFSRQAEEFLLRRGLLWQRFAEQRMDAQAAAEHAAQAVAKAIGVGSQDVYFARSGMNAFYAIFEAIGRIQSRRGRSNWIQLGWLYLDTIEILAGFHQGRVDILDDVQNLDALAKILKQRGRQVAGVVTEAPTNPLIQCARLDRLQAMCREAEVALIVDPSVASPLNVRSLPFSDAAPVSLTKYAAGKGDVILGAVALNRDSPFYAELRDELPLQLTAPFIGDLQRLACEVDEWPALCKAINFRTLILARHLEKHPAVARVHWALAAESSAAYSQLASTDAPGGLLTIDLCHKSAEFYDALQCAKGPSFGVEFTLACPFLYLAHYDLVRSPEGRERLQRAGLQPESIRISVGIEPVAELLECFDRALDVAR
ncbi:MAG: PLP-dependent transferase [Leptospirales bacterium]|nr:PLP-dependent transferase [Leptospirales bacterium]